METSINQVVLKGRVGAVRIININGTNVANFSLYTSSIQKIGNNIVEEGVWHHVVANDTKDIAFKCIQKGAELMVYGRLKQSKYTSSDGTEKILTEVIANRLENAELVHEIHTVLTQSLNTNGEFSADAHSYGCENDAMEYIIQQIAMISEDNKIEVDPYTCKEVKGEGWWIKFSIIKDTVKIS